MDKYAMAVILPPLSIAMLRPSPLAVPPNSSVLSGGSRMARFCMAVLEQNQITEHFLLLREDYNQLHGILDAKKIAGRDSIFNIVMRITLTVEWVEL